MDARDATDRAHCGECALFYGGATEIPFSVETGDARLGCASIFMGDLKARLCNARWRVAHGLRHACRRFVERRRSDCAFSRCAAFGAGSGLY